ncbi:MAG: hypothetical protein DRP57_07790 [Spirochaetes bacterium]|nr:MAG: hypothetical protein DRP57_07790 [Spirochaetota bacterium]
MSSFGKRFSVKISLRILIVIFFLIPCGFCIWADTVFINKPLVVPAGKDNTELIDSILKQAERIASDLYSEYFKITDFKKGKAERSNYTLSVTVNISGRQSIMSLQMKPGVRRAEDESLGSGSGGNSSGKAQSFTIFGYPSEDTASYMANVILYLGSSFHRYLASDLKNHPQYVDEIPTDAFKNSVIPEMPMMLMPIDIAVTGEGNLLAAFSSICVEFNGRFGIVGEPGRTLFESGNYTFASGVSATPGGTVFLKPSLGRDIYKIAGGSEKPQKLRVGFDLYGPFTALQDGSVVAVNVQKKSALIVTGSKSAFSSAPRRKVVDLFTGPYSNITAVAGGPEGNIWVYDVVERRIRIHSPEGTLLDSIIPLCDPEQGQNPVSMSIYDDGRFVLYYSSGKMACYNRLGIPLWRLSEIPDLFSGSNEPLPMIGHTAVNSKNGVIYVSDQMGKRIIKLLDVQYLKDYGKSTDFEEKIVRLNKRIVENKDVKALEEKASMYKDAGAYEMSGYLWEEVLDMEPDNGKARINLANLKVQMLMANAGKLKDKAIAVILKLGPESARLTYSRAVQMYEQVLAGDPGNIKARAEMNELKNRFQKENKEGEKTYPLKFKELKFAGLFPSLMRYYLDHPAGSVIIENRGDKSIKNIRVSSFIKKYMDFPLASQVIEELKPGRSAKADLYILFNQSVLNLEEDISAQVNVKASYTVGKDEFSMSNSKAVTLYRRTALQWNNSGKLASFITPHEDTVERFSHSSLNTFSFAKRKIPGGYVLPDKFIRAVQISCALGSYGITYVEDPDSPISKVLGKVNVEDTVRFPRKTLLLRSGDCDDTTALLCSLMESSGIETAIMTSPGHVFMAFNSGEPAGSRWMFTTNSYAAIPFKGSLWIPVETTVLERGFMHAWKTASQIYRRNKVAAKVEFLPVAVEQEEFPPISLPASIFHIIPADPAKVEKLYSVSINTIHDSLYERALASYSGKASNASGRKKAYFENKIGILNARFGREDEAGETFKKLIRQFPNYISPYVNLSNLYLIKNRVKDAEEVLKKAACIEPDSAILNLKLAFIYYRKSDNEQLLKYFLKARASSPETAARYSYLINGTTSGEETEAGGGAVERAGNAGADDNVKELENLWDDSSE